MAISLYKLSQRISSSMPLGTIVPYYGTDEPSGWKICDGRSCAGSELAKKLGISNVPDLRGRFIRMIGGNAAGMAVAQDDCIRNITGQITSSDGIMYAAKASGAIAIAGSGTSLQNGRNTYNSGLSFDASRVVPTGPENRPINTAFNYIIKVNTNVILYYVSNIIYKAIAIGKSLLSRVKEEVRRTMAISLKSLYDQVQSIKTNAGAYTEENLFVNNGADRTITVPDMSKYSAIRFWHAREGDFVSIQEVTVRYSDLKSVKKFTMDYDPGTATVTWNSDTSLTLHGGDKGYIRRAVGIIWSKAILYSFSYIILYRLTQILFDSSLLGLFSQRGGARTI